MEKSYFWNSVDGDRKYNAESISDMLLPFFKPGVFAGDLQVTAPGGMKVQIAGSEDRGFAWFRTKNYHNTANLVKDISAASGVLSRIDNVVVRKDTPNRTIYITIQEGTFATLPEAPAILRTAEFYDLKLAEITIPSGAIEITQANIKDCRMDANVCGWVAATIEEMDFTQISAQFDAYMEEYQEATEIEFTTWFNAMKGQLTTDAAGNLQTQINTINTKTGGWRTYANVSEISTTPNSTMTIKEIVPLMADKSIYRASNADMDFTDMTNGSLITFVEIIRYNVARVVIKGYRAYGTVTDELASEYFAVWNRSELVCKGFFKLIDNNDAGYSYSGITELGLNASTCTLADIWNAMASYSEIILDTGVLSAITIPTPGIHGTMHIIKSYSARQARIEFIPKITGAPYYMNLNSSNVPDGTWRQYATKDEVVLKAEQLVTLSSTGWVSMSGGYYQTVTLTGSVASSNPDWCLKPAGQIPTDTERVNDALVLNATFGTNTMTFYTGSSKPTVNLQYRVKGV